MPSPIDPMKAAPEGMAAKSGGIDAQMAALDAEFARNPTGAAAPAAPAEPVKPADPAAKPAEPDAPVVPPAKVDKPANDPLKPEPAAPVKPDVDMTEADMEKFLKAHSNKKPWKVYESLKATNAAKYTELESKIKALESKPVESPGDAAKIAAYEKQIESLSGETKTYKEQLAATQFEYTPKHQEYLAKINHLWKRTTKAVAGMQVTEDGAERQAVTDDFEQIRNAPPTKRRQMARALFGEDAGEVLGLVNEIDAAFEENNEARETFAKTHEQTSLQREMEGKSQTAKFEATYKASLDAIGKNPAFGKWFAQDAADPEGSKIYSEELAKLEKVIQDSETMSPEDAAKHAAIGRSKAAAYPRILLAHTQLEEKYKALEAELAQFRSTDPGAKGATNGGGALADNKPKGIDAAAMSFDSDPYLKR